MNARSTSQLLYLIAKLKPEAWDAIHPHGPKISAASREYLIAMAVKGFAAELSNRAAAKKLGSIQQVLVKAAGQRLVSDYNDDDWCPTPFPGPPVPVPGPGPSPFSRLSWAMLNPQPLPPKELSREIGGYLLILSEATSVSEASKELAGVGNSLLRG